MKKTLQMLIVFAMIGLSARAQITYSILSAGPTCYLGDNGEIVVDNIAGGVHPYLYSKDSGVHYQSSNLFGVPLMAGVYNILVKDAVGTISTSTTVTLTQPTEVTFTTVVVNATCDTCHNGSISVFATGGIPPYHYYIYPVNGQNDSVFTGLDSGTYYICIGSQGGCVSLGQYIFVANTVGIPEINLNTAINIFPNPASTLLHIHHSTCTSQETLLITDLLGTEVYKENLSGISTTISISTWSAGIYFYEVRSEKESARGKFIKGN
ncbi:MAG: T9SS type A sorting domain-containing protein [Bacteroidota bacterium]